MSNNEFRLESELYFSSSPAVSVYLILASSHYAASHLLTPQTPIPDALCQDASNAVKSAPLTIRVYVFLYSLAYSWSPK